MVDWLDHGDLHARTQASGRRIDAIPWDQNGALPRKAGSIDIGMYAR